MKIETLDKHFSLYIRLRDAKDEYCTCVTCGKVDHYKKMHCGHFQTRNNKCTRWNEQNAHVQCNYCNTFKHGEQYKHGKYIDKRYGKGTADKLEMLAKGVCKFTKFEIAEMVKYYREKVKTLR